MILSCFWVLKIRIFVYTLVVGELLYRIEPCSSQTSLQQKQVLCFQTVPFFFQESCLMEQTYIKDSDKRVNDIFTETIATLGENISINRYVRFAIGESSVLPSNGKL